jgi:hypothetical protein
MLGKSEFRAGLGPSMTLTRDDALQAGAGWRKFTVLVLAVAAVGLPVNHVGIYALLVIVAVVVFTGEVDTRRNAWLAALAIVAVAIAGQWLLAPPRIDEGQNLFLPGAVLQRALPPDVYKHMADQFDAAYPPSIRCKPNSAGCWQGSEPDRAFAFSADGIFHKSDLSRAASAIGFSDPVRLRLGFINERRYNWSTATPDVRRVDRDRRFYMGLHRWHLAMPWFELLRLPPAFVGGQLCWRGEVMWQGEGGRFDALSGPRCRVISSADSGRQVFGIAVKPDTLAMTLTPPWRVGLLHLARLAVIFVAAAGLVLALVRLSPRRMVLPLILIGLAAVIIAVDDASFLGGVRPFDGGDDGLFYDGVGREILQNLLSGDFVGFLKGGEAVFYYGGPGLRYFRALEHIVFGESYLGYLSLVLLLPLLTYGLLRRFLPNTWSIATAIVFTAVPVGAAFGTTFFQYAQWASRGFADPAAYVFFVAGLLTLVAEANEKFVSAFFAALLFALAIFMKPIAAPAAAVLLGGAGVTALWSRQWPRLSGLCIGFLPVFSMALHNWIFGHVFVLFSANAGDSQLLIMPPSAYAAAARELAALNVTGPDVAGVAAEIVRWLSGPAQAHAAIPVNAGGIAVLIYVAALHRFEPWLRLIAGAALAQHTVALFYDASIARYHYLAWYLTMIVAVTWLHEAGLGWLRQHYPALCALMAANPVTLRLASGLASLHKMSA